MRGPSLSPVLRIADLDRRHFDAHLAVFDVAVRGDKTEIRQLVQRGGEVARIFRLGVELSDGQALYLARQIRESLERQQSPRTQAQDDPDGAWHCPGNAVSTEERS